MKELHKYLNFIYTNSHGSEAIFSSTHVLYSSVSQPPGRGPVPGSSISYTGPRKVFLEFVILFF